MGGELDSKLRFRAFIRPPYELKRAIEETKALADRNCRWTGLKRCWEADNRYESEKSTTQEAVNAIQNKRPHTSIKWASSTHVNKTLDYILGPLMQ